MKFVNPYERKIIRTFNLAYGRICLVLFSSNLNKGYVNVYTVPFLTFGITDYSERYGYDLLFLNISN